MYIKYCIKRFINNSNNTNQAPVARRLIYHRCDVANRGKLKLVRFLLQPCSRFSAVWATAALQCCWPLGVPVWAVKDVLGYLSQLYRTIARVPSGLNSVLWARNSVWYGDGGCLGLTKPLREINSCISIEECEVQCLVEDNNYVSPCFGVSSAPRLTQALVQPTLDMITFLQWIPGPVCCDSYLVSPRLLAQSRQGNCSNVVAFIIQQQQQAILIIPVRSTA